MIDDVYEPLEKYEKEFRGKLRNLAMEKFDTLAKESKVDIAGNRALAAEIKSLEKSANKEDLKKKLFGFAIALGVAAALAALIGAVKFGGSRGPKIQILCWAVFALSAVAGMLSVSPYKRASKLLKRLKEEIAAKKKTAWDQMQSLNALYSWDMPAELISAAMPNLEFDPYFTLERQEEFREEFGLDEAFNEDKSILYSQSGQIDSNPFIYSSSLEMEWGEKTYEGTKRITWYEWEEDSDGKRRRIKRSEILRAHVTKPIPVYSEQKFLVYANAAAPNLSFTREPSGLTGKDNALSGKIKKSWRLSRLKAYSRNLDDESNFTLMANHEFETWFHAMDRDNEVEFRLLFTPIAQTQMLRLMKDGKVGYGDDFAFIKAQKINIILSSHLGSARIDTNPAIFANWNFDEARDFFVSTCEKYFKDFYFALAPLLAIPLYRQTRSEKAPEDAAAKCKRSAFWEHEAIANYLGEEHFAHPESITRNILKTRVIERGEEKTLVETTAYGYRGEDRSDYVSVYGGDGEYHDVEVEWVEYLPVANKANFYLIEMPQGGAKERFDRIPPGAGAILRRSIVSYLAKGEGDEA